MPDTNPTQKERFMRMVEEFVAKNGRSPYPHELRDMERRAEAEVKEVAEQQRAKYGTGEYADPHGIAAQLQQVAQMFLSGGADYTPNYKAVDNRASQSLSEANRQFGSKYVGMEGMPRVIATLMNSAPILQQREQGYQSEKDREQKSKETNRQLGVSTLGAASDVYGGNKQLQLAWDSETNRSNEARAKADAESGGGFLGELVGGLAGSFLGPVGSAVGSKVGGALFGEGG